MAYYKDLLQLDTNMYAKNTIQIDSLVKNENKFPWRMMCINMEDV